MTDDRLERAGSAAIRAWYETSFKGTLLSVGIGVAKAVEPILTEPLRAQIAGLERELEGIREASRASFDGMGTIAFIDIREYAAEHAARVQAERERDEVRAQHAAAVEALRELNAALDKLWNESPYDWTRKTLDWLIKGVEAAQQKSQAVLAALSAPASAGEAKLPYRAVTAAAEMASDQLSIQRQVAKSRAAPPPASAAPASAGEVDSLRPPYETFTKPTCRGSYALGSACGRCEKCEWERNRLLPLLKRFSPPPASAAPADPASEGEYSVPITVHVTGEVGHLGKRAGCSLCAPQPEPAPGEE